MATLFQIGDDVKALHNLLIECGGEITDDEAEAAIEEWFAETNAAAETKVNSICWLIREFEGRAEVREQAAKTLMASAGADANQAKRLKNRVKLFMEQCGFDKLQTEHFKLTIAANGGVVPLVIPKEWEIEPASAPEAFHKVEIRLNQNAIREAIRNDEETHGACLGDRGTHLRIR